MGGAALLGTQVTPLQWLTRLVPFGHFLPGPDFALSWERPCSPAPLRGRSQEEGRKDEGTARAGALCGRSGAQSQCLLYVNRARVTVRRKGLTI